LCIAIHHWDHKTLLRSQVAESSHQLGAKGDRTLVGSNCSRARIGKEEELRKAGKPELCACILNSKIRRLRDYVGSQRLNYILCTWSYREHDVVPAGADKNERCD